MKTNNVCRQTYRVNTPVSFPNAASRREILNKVLDFILMGAIGAGLAATLLLILTLV